MTTLEEILQKKQDPIDKWSTKEQLYLASAVVRSGDQNWESVSRMLKQFAEPDRPPDWFSQKNCAAQYGSLLKSVETPKRKRRFSGSEAPLNTPEESILKKLTEERKAELKNKISEAKREYIKLRYEMDLIESGLASDGTVERMCAEIDEEEKIKEQNAIAHAQWLKMREEKLLEMESVFHAPARSAVTNQKGKLSDTSGTAPSTIEEPVTLETSKHALSPVASSILHTPITSLRDSSPTIASLLNTSPSMPVSASLQQFVTAVISQEPPVTNIQTSTTAIKSAESPPKLTETSSSEDVKEEPAEKSDNPPEEDSSVPSKKQTSEDIIMKEKITDKSKETKPKDDVTEVSETKSTNETDEQNEIDLKIEQEQSNAEQEEQLIAEQQEKLIAEQEEQSIDDESSLQNVVDSNDIDSCLSEIVKEEEPLEDIKVELEMEKLEELKSNEPTKVELKIKPTELGGEKSKDSQLDSVDIVANMIIKEQENSNKEMLKKVCDTINDKDKTKKEETSNSKVVSDKNTNKMKEQQFSLLEQQSSAVRQQKQSLPFEQQSSPVQQQQFSLVEQQSSTVKQPSSTVEQQSSRVKEKQPSPIKQQQFSPVEQQPSSVKQQQPSPITHQFSPVEQQSSTAEEQSSPVKRQSSPAQQLSSPAKQLSSPAKQQFSPMKQQSAPVKQQSSPVKQQQFSPVEKNSATVEEQSSPVKKQPSSDKQESSLVKEQQFLPVLQQALLVKQQSSSVKEQPFSPVPQQTSPGKQQPSSDKQSSSVKEQVSPVPKQASLIKQQPSSDKQQSSSVKRSLPDKQQSLSVKEQQFSPVQQKSSSVKQKQSSPANQTTVYNKCDLDDTKTPKVVLQSKKSSKTGTEVDAPKFSQKEILTPELQVTNANKPGKAKRIYSRLRKKENNLDKTVDTSEEHKGIQEASSKKNSRDSDSKSISGKNKLKVITRRSNRSRTEEEKPLPRTRSRFSATQTTPCDSIPNSPASGNAVHNDDHDYRIWKKTIMLVYSRITSHKYASFFMKSVTENRMPDYHDIVYHPMNLQTVRRNIENGTIRSTADFQREVMLVFQNAIMYNARNESVYKMAKEVQAESLQQLRLLMEAEAETGAPFRRKTRNSNSGLMAPVRRKNRKREPVLEEPVRRETRSNTLKRKRGQEVVTKRKKRKVH